MQAAVAAIEPGNAERRNPFTVAQRSAQTRRLDLPAGEQPETWSPWRAYGMTGFTPGPGGYVPSRWGGALRPLRLYDADRHAGKRGGETDCTQVHASQKELGAGLLVRIFRNEFAGVCEQSLCRGGDGAVLHQEVIEMLVADSTVSEDQTCAGAKQVGGCPACKMILTVSLMTEPESPKHVMHVLRTRFPIHFMRLFYDNGCNADHYILNREPEMMTHLEIYIDDFHKRGHVGCLDDYNTGVTCH